MNKFNRCEKLVCSSQRWSVCGISSVMGDAFCWFVFQGEYIPAISRPHSQEGEPAALQEGHTLLLPRHRVSMRLFGESFIPQAHILRQRKAFG